MASSLVSLPPPEPPFSKGMGGQNFLKCKSDPPSQLPQLLISLELEFKLPASLSLLSS